MLLEVPEMMLCETPDRIIMIVKGLSGKRARNIANAAVRECRRKMPKMSGASAARIQPIYGQGFFGIWWADSYVWFQDHGIRPFTMRSLEGKTIPMWIDDPTGQERSKNPKAKVRTTMSGKVQVLIFRKASNVGKPGRINVREAAKPHTRAGKQGGRIAKGNVGVKWRHPGLAPRLFLNNAITLAAQWNGILPVRVYLCDQGWRTQLSMRTV